MSIYCIRLALCSVFFKFTSSVALSVAPPASTVAAPATAPSSSSSSAATSAAGAPPPSPSSTGGPSAAAPSAAAPSSAAPSPAASTSLFVGAVVSLGGALAHGLPEIHLQEFVSQNRLSEGGVKVSEGGLGLHLSPRLLHRLLLRRQRPS